MFSSASLKTKPWKKLVGVLLIVSVVFTLFAMLPSLVFGETPAEKYKRLKDELAKINTQITSYQGQKNTATALRQKREEEKILLDEAIVVKKQEIADANSDLEIKEAEVSLKRQSIADNDELLQQRLVAIYRMNTSSVMSSLLNVDDFSARNTLADGLRRISKNDTDLLNRLSDEKIALEAEEAAIEVIIAALLVSEADLEADALTLAENIAALNTQISQAEANVIAKQQVYSQTEIEYKQAEKEFLNYLNSLKGSSSSNSQYTGGVMSFPMNTSSWTRTTSFGQNGHGGVDFSTNKTTGISALAAAGGVVIQAGYHDHTYSYGNYVIIDHGGGVRSLYAHLANIAVSNGATISAGTVIGEVGNTGYSFGIHLHFEVHKDGVRQNPEAWLQG